MKVFATISERQYEFELIDKNGGIKVFQAGRQVDLDLQPLGQGRYSLIINNKPHLLNIVRKDGLFQVHLEGDSFPVVIDDERTLKLKELMQHTRKGPLEQIIKAPIPGLVVKINVSDKQQVESGGSLLILEAMKMENIIKASCDCQVAEIFVKEGQAVQQNDRLMKLISGESV